MAMEQMTSSSDRPVLCDIFPNTPPARLDQQEHSERWKSLLCNSAWRASLVVTGQDECDELDDSSDTMEADDPDKSLGNRMDLGDFLISA